MSIHIGQVIEKEAKRSGISRKELYEKLNTSRQNLYAIFKRETIDTGILMKLSSLLNYNFFKEFFTEEPLKSLVAAEDEKTLRDNTTMRNELTQKEKYIKSLEQTIDAQRKIIQLLENKNIKKRK
ncbi:MAG TPA: helix-turn-helix domain-containing protein [Arachidicoccus sp.]